MVSAPPGYRAREWAEWKPSLPLDFRCDIVLAEIFNVNGYPFIYSTRGNTSYRPIDKYASMGAVLCTEVLIIVIIVTMAMMI